ncbi:uncharacterized protein LOC131025968 [Salvia miltiorrhiza]|uniref:uncharacterized protein LOC131025968 n=1 Tax=Salvia miltiorrhiza TaxID=226208 RepID=UPI0025AD3A55|nr:uncharacterized protein LOC131025968 [Salvia miltiorrhiza]
MLAKQEWRLLTNDTSLLARSLKARYFPRNDLLLARNAHNPSFAWKSILVGRDLLGAGLAWKLGNRDRIRIGLDPWLPNGRGQFERANVLGDGAGLRARDLMNEADYTWDLRKLEEVLDHRDRWKILVQMKGRPYELDKPFWPSGKLNEYSIRSGHHLAMELRMRNEASSSSPFRILWSWIWNLDVIPKVRHFMWKCLAGALPSAMGLRSRGVDIDLVCRRCGEHEEKVEHALRDCKWIEMLWAVSPIRLSPMQTVCSIPDWFDKIHSCPQMETHAQFATLAWSIWYARNLLVFQQKEMTQVECLATALRSQWTSPMPATQIQPWASRVACSREGQLKVSSDVAVKDGVGIGIGVVMKDGENNVVGCGVFSAIEGEALAMLEGLFLCRERGITDAIFETDCQSLFWIVSKKEADLSYLGTTLNAIYGLLSFFRHAVFSWSPRDSNLDAHSLASFALCNSAPFSSAVELPSAVNSS